MKRISINNGNSFVTVAEALKKFDLETIANYMDDEARETANSNVAPCDDETFLTEYLKIANEDLIIG